MRAVAERRYVHNIPAARVLRTTMTPSEAMLWERLRDRRFLGLKFRRQHAVGRFVLDFYCDEMRLAVEVDGSVHDGPGQREADEGRQGALEELGIWFVRVSAWLVENDIEGALGEIAAAAKALTPGPSPDFAGEGSRTQPVREPGRPAPSEQRSSPSPAKSGEGVGGVRALFVIQMHGEPGSGKSTLARAIGRELPAVVLDKDIISSGMIRSGQAFGSTGPGSYLVLYGLARSVVEQGYSVVIDSPCFWPAIEENGRGIANAAHARYAMIECVCPADVVDQRLATRERLESNPAARMTGPMSPGMRAPTCHRLILDSTRGVTELAVEAVAYIRSLATHALTPGPSPDPAGEGSQAEPMREPQPSGRTEQSALPLSREVGRGGRGVRA